MKIAVERERLIAVHGEHRVDVTELRSRHTSAPYIPYAQEYDEKSWDQATVYRHGEGRWYIKRDRYVECPYDPESKVPYQAWFVSSESGDSWAEVEGLPELREEFTELNSVGGYD
jgi:hypothetical protein